jgi:hypothetical protein
VCTIAQKGAGRWTKIIIMNPHGIKTPCKEGGKETTFLMASDSYLGHLQLLINCQAEEEFSSSRFLKKNRSRAQVHKASRSNT